MADYVFIQPVLEEHVPGLWSVQMSITMPDGRQEDTPVLVLPLGIDQYEAQVFADIAVDEMIMKLHEKAPLLRFDDRRS